MRNLVIALLLAGCGDPLDETIEIDPRDRIPIEHIDMPGMTIEADPANLETLESPLYCGDPYGHAQAQTRRWASAQQSCIERFRQEMRGCQVRWGLCRSQAENRRERTMCRRQRSACERNARSTYLRCDD